MNKLGQFAQALSHRLLILLVIVIWLKISERIVFNYLWLAILIGANLEVTLVEEAGQAFAFRLFLLIVF